MNQDAKEGCMRLSNRKSAGAREAAAVEYCKAIASLSVLYQALLDRQSASLAPRAPVDPSGKVRGKCVAVSARALRAAKRSGVLEYCTAKNLLGANFLVRAS
jgi:hypothetical protein